MFDDFDGNDGIKKCDIRKSGAEIVIDRSDREMTGWIPFFGASDAPNREVDAVHVKAGFRNAGGEVAVTASGVQNILPARPLPEELQNMFQIERLVGRIRVE